MIANLNNISLPDPEFQNYDDMTSLDYPFEEIVVVYGFDYYFCIVLVNLFSLIYILLKLYRLICYAKLTLEWLPMVNPYNFPLSYLYVITNPFFKFWSSLLPNLKFQKSSFEISSIVGLECMNAVLYFCVRLVNGAVVHLELIEQGTLVDL